MNNKQRAALDELKAFLADPNNVILDIEASGCGADSDILQLAIIGVDGTIHFNEYFKPSYEVLPDGKKSAYAIFDHCIPAIQKILSMGRVGAYNVNPDKAKLKTNIPNLDQVDWVCLYNLRTAITKQQLPLNGQHEALSDCFDALRIMKELAAQDVKKLEFRTLDEAKKAVDKWLLLNQEKLRIQKEVEDLKETAIEAMKQRGVTSILALDNDYRVNLDYTVNEVRLVDGLTYEQVEQKLPGSINFEPKIKSTSSVVKNACLFGVAGDWFTFKVGETLKEKKI